MKGHAVVILLSGIRTPARPSVFRRMVRIELRRAIAEAYRSNLIDAPIAEETWRAITEGSQWTQ